MSDIEVEELDNYEYDEDEEEYASDFSFEEEDDDDQENDSSAHDSDFKDEDALSTRSPLVQFKHHTMKEIAMALGLETKNLASILALSEEQALTLSQTYSWNTERLMEEYMEDPAKVKVKAGIVDTDDSNEQKSQLKTYSKGDFMCYICCEEKTESYQLSCGDEYCVDCYSRYVKERTSSGKVIKCPNCDVALNVHDLELIGGEGESFKLIESSIKEYVERNQSYKWCPSPDCNNVVEILNINEIPNIVQNQKVPVANCNHGHQFCVACSFENHTPCPCPITKQWITKCNDDSETVNWIMSNTQSCPKCDSSIEKNGGCNHMTCKKCHYEFCWICMEDWKKHGNSFYQCNRFHEQPEDRKKDLKDKNHLKNVSKTSLKRYLHYYNLFRVHETSIKQDVKRCKFVEDKVRELQESSGISWIEAQFLVESAEILLKARRILKWTYSFAYYCDRNNYLEIFETVQHNLSEAVENLSKLFEIEDPLEIVKQKLDFLNRSRFLNDRQQAMVSCTQESITNGNLNTGTLLP